jgi:hypothetical protein
MATHTRKVETGAATPVAGNPILPGLKMTGSQPTSKLMRDYPKIQINGLTADVLKEDKYLYLIGAKDNYYVQVSGRVTSKVVAAAVSGWRDKIKKVRSCHYRYCTLRSMYRLREWSGSYIKTTTYELDGDGVWRVTGKEIENNAKMY